MHKTIGLWCILWVQNIAATSLLQIQNTTANDIYAATYSYKKGSWSRTAPVKKVLPQDVINVSVETSSFFSEQRLVVALHEKQLPDVIQQKKIVLPSMELKSHFYFYKKMVAAVHQTDSGLMIQKGSKLFSDITAYGTRAFENAKEKVRKKVLAMVDHDQAQEQGVVTIGNALNPKERACIEKRTEYIRAHLATFLGVPESEIERVPRIGMICSGGGMRAMVSTFGWLEGAQKTGLLDTITYIAGLSGSTWAIGSWLTYQSNKAFKDKTLSEIKDGIFENITDSFTKLSAKELKDIVNALMIRAAYDQSITLVDIFQYFLANKLFKNFADKKYSIALSDQYSLVAAGSVPFPLYTAVFGNGDIVRFKDNPFVFGFKSANKPWFEFSPVEVGTTWFGGLYVPTWAFGRTFYDGVSVDFSPSITVSKMMATCGSAYAATVETVWKKAKDSISNPLLKKYLENLKEKEEVWLEAHGTKHVPYSMTQEPNFAHGMNIQGDMLKEKKHIKLKDAGLSFNLPYPPLSGERCSDRKMDILIICDASASLAKGKTSGLEHIALYAQQAGLPFPKISLEDQGVLYNKPVSIFEDVANPNAPIVIYMPLCQNQDLMNTIKPSDLRYGLLKNFDLYSCFDKTCSTFNFKWPKQTSEAVSRLMEYSMIAHKDQLKDVIKRKTILQKKSQK